MNKSDGMFGLTALITFTLYLGTAQATVFDAGLALKADMAQITPTNSYTDADGGVWTFGKTTRVLGGTVTTLDKPDQYWGDTIKGFADWSALPTINVNTGDVAVTCVNGLSDGSHPIAPGEIVLHPNDGPTLSRFAIVRFVVPQTGVYDVSATFRDVSVADATVPCPGVDVHVVVNGKDLTRAVVSADSAPSAGALPSFTADLRSLSLTASSTIDFVIGPNGTESFAYGADGTALRATITLQPPHLSDIINLDINGYGGEDSVPGSEKAYSGAAVVGAAGDFWNSAAIKNFTFAELTVPQLKLADGITRSTVRFSINKADGLLHGDCRGEIGSNVNPLLDDYVYILTSDTPQNDSFTISGLVPNATYDLYIYSHAGADATPGRFTINGTNYDSVLTWVVSGDYAKCLGIAADVNGVIAGDFSRADPGLNAVINGLQIVGTFPLLQTEIVNLDINGYNPTEDLPPGAGDTYFGAARVGGYEDFWNSVAVADMALGIWVPSLKLANGITHNTTVSFSMSKVGGGSLNGNRSGALNALLTDYVFIPTESTDSYAFTIAGLVPNAAYDLFFYGNEAGTYAPGRFVIKGVTYDSIDMTFRASGGGDTAVCAGITADSSGAITGEFSRAVPGSPAALNGLQIVGTFPHQHADIVNLDINGFGPSSGYEAGSGDAYSGAAEVGAAGDHWNCAAVKGGTVASITVPNLKLADGITNTTVCFSLSTGSDAPLGADRMAPGNRLNPLLDDCVYIYGNTPTNRFTLSGLVPYATYDLFFYSDGGPTLYPGRFIIDGMVCDSVNFSANVGGDYALYAGITADSSGAITGEFCQACQDLAATFDGLQIVGTFPRQHADIVNLDINGYMPPEPVAGDAYSGAARVGAAGDFWNSVAVANYTVASITVPHLKLPDGATRSTVTFSLSMEGEGTLGADHIYEAPLNSLLDDYVYFYGETIRFTITCLVPDTPYDLYFYCHAGPYFNPARFTINGSNYYSYDTCFQGGDRGDYAVCAGITADSSGTITGTFCKANPDPAAAGVLNGVQIMGTIPLLPLGTIMTLK